MYSFQEIHIHVADTKLVLLPPTDRRGYPVKHDGRDVRVFEPVVFHKDHEIYGYIERAYSDNHLRIIAKKAGINVLYDGTTVKIQVRQLL